MTFNAFADFAMTDHVALITGGAQNIGRAIATSFSGAGARVAIADLNGDLAEAAAAEISHLTGNPVLGLKCDVTDTQMTDEAMIASYRLNTLSALRMTQAAMPHLLKSKNPSVTNSGSLVSVLPAFDFIAYSSAKAALNHLMLSLAHAFAKKARFNTVLIGTVITETYAQAGLDEKAQQALAHPDNLTGRSGRPEDVANAFLWLASPAGSWVSGQTIQVSGGPRRLRLKPE